MSSKTYQEEIRKRIQRQYDNRTEFASHLIAFLGTAAVLWGVLQPQYGWATLSAIIMGGWLIGLLIHATIYGMKEAQERAIEREIERERAWRSQYPELKQKRGRLQLSEDGEILDIVDDQPYAQKR
ncbi:MAG: 2TM domain-containing protein [Chloroflexi bacterium]|nr:2TM domain-containing protein [Chloroflexota bacterium]